MGVEESKAVVQRLFEEVFNQRRDEALDEIVAPEYVAFFPGQGEPLRGPEGIKRNQEMYRAVFPDIHETIEDMISEGDKVVVRWTGTGTHEGTFMHIPPTGQHVTVTGINIFRVAGGKLVEGWIQMDMVGVLRQLGVIPGT